MIIGAGGALGLAPGAAALTLALGTALAPSASAAVATARVRAPAAATARVQAPAAAAGGLHAPASAAGRLPPTDGWWTPAWSWGPGARGLPKGCSPYSGGTGAGMRWSPSLVRVIAGGLRLATSGASAGDGLAGSGSGIGCQGRAQRYARVKVRARIPQGTGLVARIALWPSTAGRGSDWSGLTVPSADVGPAYATNGCGDEGYGAEVQGRLAGAFHDYLITWSPAGFAIAVDGRAVYQDRESFDGPRWLGISLSATGPSTARAPLIVQDVVAESWAGSAIDPPTGAADGTARARPAALTTPADGALAAALVPTHEKGALSMGGGLVALGVLLGIVRSARAARRRSLRPR